MRNRHRRLAVPIVIGTIGVIILAPPSVAQSVPVSPAGEVQSGCPTFTWSAVDRAEGHEIVIYAVDSEGEVGSTPLVSKRLPAGTSAWTPSTESCLEAGDSYAWSVRTVGGTGSPEWSEAALFRVSDAPSVDEVERAIRTLRRYLRQRKGSEPGNEDPPSVQGVDRLGQKQGKEAPGRAQAVGTERPLSDRFKGRLGALSSGTIARLSPRAVSAGSYALAIDGHFDLGGFVFKNGYSLLHTEGGSTYSNTALGLSALVNVTPGDPNSSAGRRNTAIGYSALVSNTSGSDNTAIGTSTLYSNTSGETNTAIGAGALVSNTSGGSNTAVGFGALLTNAYGDYNTAIGFQALDSHQSYDFNTAVGSRTLYSNTIGAANTAIGAFALYDNTTGERNIALGAEAGKGNDTGSDNIWIGNDGYRESNTLRIGEGTGTGDFQQDRAFISGIQGAPVTGDPVLVASTDQIGVSSSSRRFKEEIEPLDEVGSRLLELEPVTFRYRPDLVSGGGDPEVGLIAEEVAELFPELVTRDPEGEPFGVRYDLLSVLLLQELQRQHELHDAHRRNLLALRERLTALEEGRPEPEEEKSLWKRIFARDRDSP